MHLDPASAKEIRHIAFGEIIGALIECAILLLLGRFSVKAVLFICGGCLVAVTGFVWLCLSIQSVLKKQPEQVKGAMTKSYLGRMVLCAGWVVVSVKFGGDPFTQIAGAIPVLFPSLTIKIMNLLKSLKKDEGEQQ